MTGFRGTALRVITWRQLVDIWIASQRRRGTLVTPLAPVNASVSADAFRPPTASQPRIARAPRAYPVLSSGGTVADAAIAAGYDDPFTLSNALHRATGFRPTALPAVGWQHLVDAWIARQRHRGARATPEDRPNE